MEREKISSKEAVAHKLTHTIGREEEREYKLRIASAEIDELRHGLKYAEMQHAKAKENADSFHKKLIEAETTIDGNLDEIKKLTGTNAKQEKRIRELQIKIEDEIEEHKDKSEKQQYRLLVNLNELHGNAAEIKGLRSDVAEKEASNHKSIVRQDVKRHQISHLEQALAERDVEIVGLKRQLQAYNKTVDSLHCARRTEGAGMVEVEHLKLDNQRLLALLKSTKEFKDFAEIADASAGRIHFANEPTPQENR